MEVTKKKTDILFVRGVTPINKKYIERTARKNKVKLADVLNKIILETRKGERNAKRICRPN